MLGVGTLAVSTSGAQAWETSQINNIDRTDVIYKSRNFKQDKKIMKFELLTLPYATDALQPVISKQTVELHHGKHLANYVNTMNSIIEGDAKYEGKSLVEVVRMSEGKLFNQAGQTLNHNIYFTQFAPVEKAQKTPSGDLSKAIDAKFGSFEGFKKEFNTAAAGVFGSGWCFLVTDKEGNLSIVTGKNAENPVTDNLIPLVAIDVWEHAYYLDYQNRRADHLTEVWKIVDWSVIERRYAERTQELKY